MEWFFSLPFYLQLLCFYLFLINIATFFTFGIDKLKASGDYRRISEKTLWILSLLGGSLGALTAMQAFRHKTKKTSFQIVFLLILFLQIALILLFFHYFSSSKLLDKNLFIE